MTDSGSMEAGGDVCILIESLDMKLLNMVHLELVTMSS